MLYAKTSLDTKNGHVGLKNATNKDLFEFIFDFISIAYSCTRPINTIILHVNYL